MADSMRYRLTDERQRLMDKLRSDIEDLPDTQWKADLLDMALTHLLESIRRHEEFDGDPEVAKAFRTSVVRPRYRTWLELKRP